MGDRHEWGQPAIGLPRLREAPEQRAVMQEVVVVGVDVTFSQLASLAIKGILAILTALVVLSPIFFALAIGAVFALSLLGTVLAG